MTENRERAIVLGGSIAGTLAARVLADSFREVVVVDRDKLLGVREPRRGAPHTVHAHGLLARGHLIIEELFPGITQEMSDTGVPTYDIGEIRWYFNGRRLALADTGTTSIAARRPVLEAHIRDRVAALPNVVFREQHDILQPVASPDRSRIVGVQIARQAAEGEPAPEPETLTADLVVDATGRGSRTPAWLESLGYERPQEEKVKIALAYATRHYRLPRSSPAINVIVSPASHRGAFFAPVGPDTYICTLNGMLGDHPPTEPEGFEAFMRSLPVGGIADVLRDAEPLDDPIRFNFPASTRRRYELLTRFPEGLLILGDSMCSFNPLYGQGMSVAALESMVLRRHLALDGERSSQLFLKDVAAVVDAPWELSAGSDLNFPEVEGPRPGKLRFLNAYIGKLQLAATRDSKVSAAFMRVAGLLDPPQALMLPRIVIRVLINGILRPPPPAPVRSAAAPAVQVPAPRTPAVAEAAPRQKS